MTQDLRAAVEALTEGTLTARDYCEACLERVRASEPSVKAWATLDEGRARAIAATRDVRDARGALHGIPVGVKDIFDRSEEHTSELQSLRHLVCRLLLEKKKENTTPNSK